MSENPLKKSSSLVARRDLLGTTAFAALTTLGSDKAEAAASQASPAKTRIAVCATYWGATNSHADWIVTKLMDGYWWHGAHKESRVEVVSVYLHQPETSVMGQKVCKAKNVPIYKTIAEALTLGGTELAVDGVVLIGEHGNYPTDLKGHWLLPRWWMFQQVVRVFEQSKRSVPVFNDKHFSYNWDDAKWMFDKSRELNFPLTGGSCIPVYYRKPEIDIPQDAPIKHSIVLGGAPDEGGIFHCIDLLQAMVERRKGGETGVKSVQSLRGGAATWKWVERTPWAVRLLDGVTARFNMKKGALQENPQANACLIEYNDGTKAAILSARNVGWTYAGEIEGDKEPTITSMLGFAGPFDQYHAGNGQPHWIVETMVTKKEPFPAERLLLSTGITNNYMESNWENGVFSPVGRRVLTPTLNIRYRSTRESQFNAGPRPPARPYIRGF